MDTLQRVWPEHASPAPPVEVQPRPEAAPRRLLGALGFLGDTIRRRRSGRLALWALVVALAGGGVWLIAYPFVTDVWAGRIQDGLEEDFKELEQTSDPATSTYIAPPKEGSALTRLRIPKLGLRMIVVEGVSGNALRAGAGHFPETALPGSTTGNVVIAGHRTGYGDPFLHIDRLTQGDKIVLETPFGRFVYRVMPPAAVGQETNPWIVRPTDLSVKGNTIDPVLTLITCDPPGTSKNRLIVRAALERD